MKTQKGWRVNATDLMQELVKVEDLVYYDGPLLSHYRTEAGKHYLFSFVDTDEVANRWLVLEITIAHLYDYLTDSRTLFDIYQQDYNAKLVVADTDGQGDFVQALLVPSSELDPEYLPEPASYFELAMPASYDAFFEAHKAQVSHAAYLAGLRARAVHFLLKPIAERYGATVSAHDVGGFLQRFTRSYKSFFEVRFLDLARPFYALQEELVKALDAVLEAVEPRVVYANKGSFEVDLAVDVLQTGALQTALQVWQKQVLQEFKRDVFDFDFATAAQLPESLANAEPAQIRAVYLPMVQIANNRNYVVQARNSPAEPYTVLKPVTTQQQRDRLPSPPKNEEVEVETELSNILLELVKGQDPTKISLRQLRQAMVAVSTGDHSTALVAGLLSSEGQEITFTEPIEVALVREGSFYEASFEPLAIQAHGATAKAALDAFDRELRTLYARYLLNKSDREQGREGLRSERDGRIMTALEELL